MKTSLLIIALVLFAALSCCAESITWYSINSGGGVAASEAWTIQATIGQPVAGVVTTPPYTADPRIHYIGFWSGDLRVPLLQSNLADAKLLSPGAYISLADLTVTTVSASDFADRLYLEAGDRSSGIQLYHGSSALPALAEGTRVSVIGSLQAMQTGELALVGSQVIPLQTGDALRPLGMRTGQVGGKASGQPGIIGSADLNNIGLLVRVWGQIEGLEAGTDYLLLSDGSGTSLGPLRIDTSELTSAPESGYIQITGISSVEYRGVGPERRLVPVVRPRRPSDAVPITAL